jgi:uncharacterized protein
MSGTSRLVVWRGLDGWRAEASRVDLGEGRLSARGTQIGGEPDPYTLEYELDTADGYVTRTLVVEAFGAEGTRTLELRRAGDGSWTENGRPLPELGGALDCDLGLCPLTNTMPVLRHRLLDPGAEPRDFVMAWVAVPELTVHRSEQRYEPIDRGTVRYVGKHREFVGELTFDDAGLVVRYPELAERVGQSSAR